MKKRINFRKFGRTSSHRWAMLRNMVTSLIEHERIITTTAKAKEMQRIAEKLITTAKNPNKLHARRQINKIVFTATEQTKLLNVLGPRYEHRSGGYTRVLKLAKPRKGDAADMSVIEYVDRPGEIRAARPPKFFQQKAAGVKSLGELEELLQGLGIEDSNNDGGEGSESINAVEETK